MAMALQLPLPLKWREIKPPLPLAAKCALSKQSLRLLSPVDAAAGDASAGHRLVRKFVASTSKAAALEALSHLLSSDVHRYASLALPLYERIAETRWFNWNSKLVSEVIASLDKQGRFHEAENLISESVEKLGFRDREVAFFYCDLIDSFSKQGSLRGVFDAYDRLKRIGSDSSNVKRRAFESMINGLCRLDLPRDAEKMMMEMREAGFKPSAFEFRSVINGYGKLGFLGEMRRIVDEMEEGFDCVVDTICSNIVLSCYGAHGELSAMASWLQRMKNSGTPFSIRTYNSVLNSCATIMTMLQFPKSVLLSIEELLQELPKEEALLVQELIDSSVLIETLQWSSSEAKLDLHGMHLGSAYLIMLQWVEELKLRFGGGDTSVTVIPTEIKVVCGKGKHSNLRGESPIKSLVSEMMIRWKSPLRIDRKNVATFIAKGSNVRNWLSRN
ncbi:hypothetical protein Sjap_009838 [Stephania japonica]|uniref:Smr domain-containing protein n=1 Tax=Stephania japonica TaxID=461633 RepID=A0AAP0J8E7_9MAGN